MTEKSTSKIVVPQVALPQKRGRRPAPRTEAVMPAVSEAQENVYELMDRKDDQQILAELQGRFLDEYVYEFPQDGKTVTGLSWIGTKEASREYGGIQVPLEKLKIIAEDDKSVTVAVTSFLLLFSFLNSVQASNRFSKEIILSNINMENNNNKTKQTAHDTPLFRETYKLYLAWYRRCQTIPKKDRFAIGQKTENLLLEMMTLVVAAYHTKDITRKREILFQINLKLESVKILLRLAKDVRAIEQQPYIDYESRLQEIGKMVGGWMRQTQSSSIR